MWNWVIVCMLIIILLLSLWKDPFEQIIPKKGSTTAVYWVFPSVKQLAWSVHSFRALNLFCLGALWSCGCWWEMLQIWLVSSLYHTSCIHFFMLIARKLIENDIKMGGQNKIYALILLYSSIHFYLVFFITLNCLSACSVAILVSCLQQCSKNLGLSCGITLHGPRASQNDCRMWNKPCS
jgi:hypothetical protein